MVSSVLGNRIKVTKFGRQPSLKEGSRLFCKSFQANISHLVKYGIYFFFINNNFPSQVISYCSKYASHFDFPKVTNNKKGGGFIFYTFLRIPEKVCPDIVCSFNISGKKNRLVYFIFSTLIQFNNKQFKLMSQFLYNFVYLFVMS